MPEGDWTATVKFSSEFLAGWENYFLALLQDKEHWISANLYPDWNNIGQGQSLIVGLSRKSAADSLSWHETLFSRPDPGPNEWNKFISNNKLSQPIYLRLQRAGHDFIVSGRLETSDPDAWVTLNKIAELQASGNLVLGVTHYRQGTGQTQVKVEWIKIETP